MTPPGVRVMVIDDHEVVRRGVVEACEVVPALHVVAEAGSVAEALRRGAAARPDVALVDLDLPDGTGLDVIRGLSRVTPGTRYVILTGFLDDGQALASRQAGARAYVLKSVRGSMIAQAVLSVAAGQVLLDAANVAQPRGTMTDLLSQLTTSEHAVLECIGDGLSNRESGQRLGISEKTVKNHVTSLMGKMGFKRRTQAAAWVVSHQHAPRGAEAAPRRELRSPAARPTPASGAGEDHLERPGLPGPGEGVVGALEVRQVEAVRDQVSDA